MLLIDEKWEIKQILILQNYFTIYDVLFRCEIENTLERVDWTSQSG